MIVKTFFLAKIIHRIGTKNLRDKKSLRENLARIIYILRISGSSLGGPGSSLGISGSSLGGPGFRRLRHLTIAVPVRRTPLAEFVAKRSGVPVTNEAAAGEDEAT
jgi:hypothetical protein